MDRHILDEARAKILWVRGFTSLWAWIEDPRSMRGSMRHGGYLLALLLLGFFLGIGKLVDGVIYLLRPQLEPKSVLDLSD